MSRNDKFTKEDFAKRPLVYESALDVKYLNNQYPDFSELLVEQGWEISLLTSDENVLVPLIKDFYHSMILVNLGYIQTKVGGIVFHRRLQHIVEYLHIPKSGDETYFNNFRMASFLETYLLEEHITNLVVNLGVRFKNPVNFGALTKMAFMFWQVMTFYLKLNTSMRYYHLHPLLCSGSSLPRRSTCQCSSLTTCSNLTIKRRQVCHILDSSPDCLIKQGLR